jgi:hypothetical protein
MTHRGVYGREIRFRAGTAHRLALTPVGHRRNPLEISDALAAAAPASESAAPARNWNDSEARRQTFVPCRHAPRAYAHAVRLPLPSSPLLAASVAILFTGCSPLTPPPRECRSFPSSSPHDGRPLGPNGLAVASKSVFRVGSCAEVEMSDVTDERPIYGLGTGRISTLRVYRYVTGPRFLLIDTGKGLRICENEPMQQTYSYPKAYEDWISWDLPGGDGAPTLPETPPCATPRPAPDVSTQPALTTFPIVEGASCEPFGFPEWGGSGFKIEGDFLAVPYVRGHPFHAGARVGGVVLYERVEPGPVLELRACSLSVEANEQGNVQYTKVSVDLAPIKQKLGATGLRLAPRTP